nr:MAG: ORF1 [TTV-like mini virus]
MPPYNYNWRRRWFQRRRRRPWFRRRRPRKTFRRRYYRRYLVRRRRKRFYKKKKAARITVKEWQPQKIVKSTIKGDLCLIACGQQRQNFNFTLYMESIIPVKEPGGGGWSVMQLTLRALYDEFLHYKNYWTKGNQGLPLIKYSGCEFKFYRSQSTDYLVTICTCPPFEVTLDSYLNTQPSRQLMNYKTIIVPKLSKTFKKKPYIRKRIKPPSLFATKWYFQQDIINIPFVMLTTVACDLDQMFIPDDQISYNITLYSLNIEFFENPQWQNLPTSGYLPKQSGGVQSYLWTTGNGTPRELKWKDLIPLRETKRYKEGKKLTGNNYTNLLQEINKQENWGNPFIQQYAHYDVRYYYGPNPKATDTADSTASVTLLHELYFQCRYNPFKDKGIGNKFYFKSTSLDQGTFFNIPTKPEIYLENYPIWLVMWSWIEWIKKSKPIQHINSDYQLVIQSDYIEPKRRGYLFLDRYFTTPNHEILTETDKANWHPKTEMQTEAINALAMTGPATPKINHTKSIEAHCNYRFFVKFGGCPAPMENITNPADQEKFPTPNTINQGLKIQDPKTQKEFYLYTWDERKHTLTSTAAKRIKKDSFSDESITGTPSKQVPAKTYTETEDETSTEEEDQASLRDHLRELKLQQRKLKRTIHRLTNGPKLFP